jgi:hypothetical protein
MGQPRRLAARLARVGPARRVKIITTGLFLTPGQIYWRLLSSRRQAE